MRIPVLRHPSQRVDRANQSAFAICDGYPVTPGHALVITRRHIGDWWQATPAERTDLFALVDEIRATIIARHSPTSVSTPVRRPGRQSITCIFHLESDRIVPSFTIEPDHRAPSRRWRPN
ncbi:HIT domain-containing protein [Gordonia sp. CPCC 206044]|uniref:HIT family protein n=1 Tax=Gordonia sp. CPCC 206044 TaxID=3140793 RepID=UPI003AF405DB